MEGINRFYKSIFITALLLFTFGVNAQTAIDTYGQLSVSGTNMVSSTGEPVQLRGMSLFWSNWQRQYYKRNVVEWLKNDWCANVVRTAMGVSAGDPNYPEGYMHNRTAELAKVETVIDAAIELGIYVVVDFHSHHASDADETVVAIEFFDYISNKYGDYPNIIYEPFNEPLNNVSWSNTIKPYHETIITQLDKMTLTTLLF